MKTASALLITSLCFAASAQAVDVKIENAWVRATVPGQRVAGAFMDITATRNMKLLTGSTPAAETVELHFMRMDGDRMEMRELKSIKLPRGKTVSLAPGGLHVMLTGLKAPINAGDSVPLRLTVSDAAGKRSRIDVTLDVPGWYVTEYRLGGLRRGNLSHLAALAASPRILHQLAYRTTHTFR